MSLVRWWFLAAPTPGVGAWRRDWRPGNLTAPASREKAHGCRCADHRAERWVAAPWRMKLNPVALSMMAAFKILCDHIEPLAPVGEFLGE